MENRVTVPALDEILGKPFPVLHDGFVRVVDYMGGDSSIVQAARVSYGEGTKKVSQDRALIRYLLRHAHTTPFEMCELKLHVRVPMDVWRQWIRHRTASVNEYSTRYSIAIDSAHNTEASEWRTQSDDNRQGSGAPLPVELGAELSAEEIAFHENARQVYEHRIAVGVAREQARKDLPLSTYTEAYWKCDLHNLLHFLALRMESHAQAEIRAYANTIGNEIVSRWVPFTWEAFQDYRLGSVSFSRDSFTLLGLIAKNKLEDARTFAAEHGLTTWDPETSSWKLSREAREFQETLKSIGLSSPWC